MDTLESVLPSLRSLTAADKLRLIRILAEELAPDSDIAPLEHGRTYICSTPVFEPGAAEALLSALKTSAA